MCGGAVLQKVCIQLQPDERRAFAAESWGMAMALASTTQEEVLSDCKAVVDGVQGGKALPVVKEITKTCGRRAKWIRSHPEKRMLRKGWSLEDHAIYAADRVASGQTDAEVMSHRKCSNFLLTHVRVPQLVKDGIWYEGRLSSEQQHRDICTYLEKRGCSLDEFRWTQGLMHCTPGQRGAVIKLQIALFDRDRKARAGTLERCGCGCGNTLDDWRTTCKIGRIRELREEILPMQGELMHITEDILQTTAGWRGILSLPIRERMRQIVTTWTKAKILQMRREFRMWMGNVVSISLQMYHVAGHKGEGKDGRGKLRVYHEEKLQRKTKKSRIRGVKKRQRTLEVFFKRKEMPVQEQEDKRKQARKGVG